MATHTTVRSKPLAADAAHELVVEIEHLGVDTSHITVTTPPAESTEATSRADREAVMRPAKRVALGSAAGAMVAVVSALIVAAIWDVQPAPLLIGTVIVGATLGALYALYFRLAMSPDVYDADSGSLAVVETSIEGLSPSMAEHVTELVHRA
jgi:hypothetical protein